MKRFSPMDSREFFKFIGYKVSPRVSSRSTDTRGKKESGGCSRGPWRILNIHLLATVQTFWTNLHTRVYICTRVTSRDKNRERNRANPPAIHCDFRQLAGESLSSGRETFEPLSSTLDKSESSHFPSRFIFNAEISFATL